MEEKQLDLLLDQFVEENKDQFIEDMKELVRIRSVKDTPSEGAPFGKGCREALGKAVEIAGRYGFETEIFGDQVGAAMLGDQENHIGAIAHMDVVPEASGWIYEPYEPIVKDGYMIGRGVSDNKGPGVSVLYALRFIKENNIPLKHGLRLMFGSDEETGMADVEYYLKNVKPPVFTLVPDAMYPVCYGEKGIFEGNIISQPFADTHIERFEAGVASNVVPDRATLVLKNVDFSKLKAQECETVTVTQEGQFVTLQATGTSAHAAMPEGSLNAIGEACKVASKSGVLSAQEKEFFDFIANLVSTYYGEGLAVNCEDEIFGKLTCIAGMSKFEKGKLVININIRYPLAIKDRELEEKIVATLTKVKATIDITSNGKTHYFDKDHPAVGVLTDLYNNIFEKNDKPYVTGGGTYARKFPNAVGFGVSVQGAPNPMPEHHGGAHQPDEVANLEDLYRGIKVYVKAFMALDKMEF